MQTRKHEWGQMKCKWVRYIQAYRNIAIVSFSDVIIECHKVTVSAGHLHAWVMHDKVQTGGREGERGRRRERERERERKRGRERERERKRGREREREREREKERHKERERRDDNFELKCFSAV